MKIVHTLGIVILVLLTVGAISIWILNWWAEYDSRKPNWILIIIIVVAIIIINSVILGDFKS
jgi:hypothetical protein